MVWMFLCAQSVNKIEILQKRALHVLYDNLQASYRGGREVYNECLETEDFMCGNLQNT